MKVFVVAIVIVVLGMLGYVVVQKNATGELLEQGMSGTVLDLSGKGLTKVPSDVFEQTALERLDLSGNSLEGALPGEIRHLQNLKVLNLSNNRFTGVPAEIGQLKALEILDLSHNALTGLPYELGNLSNLVLLDLSGNDYSEADLTFIIDAL